MTSVSTLFSHRAPRCALVTQHAQDVHPYCPGKSQTIYNGDLAIAQITCELEGNYTYIHQDCMPWPQRKIAVTDMIVIMD